jgi:hypothetical protein
MRLIKVKGPKKDTTVQARVPKSVMEILKENDVNVSAFIRGSLTTLSEIVAKGEWHPDREDV